MPSLVTEKLLKQFMNSVFSQPEAHDVMDMAEIKICHGISVTFDFTTALESSQAK